MSESFQFIVVLWLYCAGMIGVVLYSRYLHRVERREFREGLAEVVADIKRARTTFATNGTVGGREQPRCHCCGGPLLVTSSHHHGDGRYPVSAATDPEPVDPSGDGE